MASADQTTVTVGARRGGPEPDVLKVRNISEISIDFIAVAKSNNMIIRLVYRFQFAPKDPTVTIV